jgi:hypothetical protein
VSADREFIATNVSALVETLANSEELDTKDVPALRAGFALLEQFLVDINRIANAVTGIEREF